ncbi:MAG: helix-turn-helix domain-containing protein, partial [Stenotrophobium sp.]
MNPENMLQNQSAEPAAPQSPDSNRASPGELIRRARERARLTPEELAAQTKLARHTLEALESDDFDTLNEAVYVRGYYRKCAKVLGIPEKELLDLYQARVAPRAPSLPSKLHLASGTELGSGSRLPVALAILAAIAAVVVCAFLWFARGEPGLPPSVIAKAVTPPAAEQKSTGAAAAAAVESAPGALPNAQAATAVAAPEGSATTAPVAPAAQLAPVPAQKSFAGSAPASTASGPSAVSGAGGSG